MTLPITPELRVEVHKGIEGLKYMMNECIRVNKELVGFGIDEKIFREN